MVTTSLLLVAAALPPWSVGADGKTCVLIDEGLAAELKGWVEDHAKSSPNNGIWTRYNPAAPRQAVLLFDSEQTCRAAVGAVGGEPKGKRLRPSDVRRELDTLVRDDRERAAVWRMLTEKERKVFTKEIERAFAGNAVRRKIVEVLDRLHLHLGRSLPAPRERQERLDRLRVEVYEHFFRVVFGERFRPARPPP